MVPRRPPRWLPFVWLVLLTAAAAPAGAEPPWTPARVREQRELELARLLRARLTALPGVVSAEARVDLPDPLSTPLDETPPPPAVALTLTRDPTADATRPDLSAAAVEVVGSLVAGSRPEAVRVRWLTSRPVPESRWSRVGPFQVSPASAGWLRATLLGLLATTSGLSALLLGYVGRRRRS